jgi:hypothetical protein
MHRIQVDFLANNSAIPIYLQNYQNFETLEQASESFAGSKPSLRLSLWASPLVEKECFFMAIEAK